MALPNIFSKEVTEKVIERLNRLTPQTQPSWGKMNVAQMLAHCCVTYEMAYENKHKKPNAVVRFLLKTFVKNGVVNETPYKHNLQAAPAFKIAGEKEFDYEKNRLVNYIYKTQQLGEKHFEDKESLSFGKLSKTEWNNMFYKHLDHHLQQFGV